MNWRWLVPWIVMVAALAQGPRGIGPQPSAPALRAGGALSTAQIVEIEGQITSISIEAGVQYPAITIGDRVIKVAPVWYLLDNDFELSVGDTVKVKAAHCLCSEDVWYALEIAKDGTTLVLRDSLGIPLWVKGLGQPDGAGGNGAAGGSRSNAPGSGACMDPASAAMYEGTVVTVNAGIGIQQPTVVLKTADGKIHTIRLAPERVLLEYDVELAAGASVRILAALASCTDTLVALELTTADGVTVKLRDEAGRPVWPR